MPEKNVIIRGRITPDIKKQTTEVLHSIGLTMSDAIRLMCIRIAHDKAMPFEPLIPNETTLAAMRDAREGRNLHHADTIDDLMKDLNAND